MSETEKVIFESSAWGSRYRVEYQEPGGWRWESDRGYMKKTSAIARAEDLVQERGIDNTRVVDTRADA